MEASPIRCPLWRESLSSCCGQRLARSECSKVLFSSMQLSSMRDEAWESMYQIDREIL